MHKGGYHDYLSEIFCLTVPKNFVGEPFCVSQNFWYRKILWIRAGEGRREGVSRFCFKNFLSHSAEKLRRGIFQCFSNFGYSKILCITGVYHDFLSKNFCLTVPKSTRGARRCFRKNLVLKLFIH